MVKYLSDQNQLAIQFEPDTFATASGARVWVGQVQEHTADESTGVIPIRYQGSTDRNVDAFADGPKDFTGTFNYFPQDWRLLGFAIGSIDDSAEHVLTETNSDNLLFAGSTISLPTFTLEDSKNNGTAGSNFIRTFGGCMINTFTTTFSQGEITNCEVDYMAQTDTFTSGAVTAVTPTVTKPHLWNEASLQVPSGTVIDNVTEMTLTINNNLEAGHYINGSREIKEQLPLNRDIELAVTLNMDTTNAKTFYSTRFLEGTEFNSMVQSVGADAGSVFIVLSGCKITDMETPSPVEGIHEQTMTISVQNVSAEALDGIAKYYAR